jgi:PleD family two-component response regulator
MTPQADHHPTLEQGRQLRTVALVARAPRVNLLDAVLDAGDYDVVFIESIDRAYTQIRESRPHVVILCLDVDDAAGFQILSMLTLDSATCEIPIITYIAPPGTDASDGESIDVEPEAQLRTAVLPMN